jgi:hypothetical protein
MTVVRGGSSAVLSHRTTVSMRSRMASFSTFLIVRVEGCQCFLQAGQATIGPLGEPEQGPVRLVALFMVTGRQPRHNRPMGRGGLGQRLAIAIDGMLGEDVDVGGDGSQKGCRLRTCSSAATRTRGLGHDAGFEFGVGGFITGPPDSLSPFEFEQLIVSYRGERGERRQIRVWNSRRGQGTRQCDMCGLRVEYMRKRRMGKVFLVSNLNRRNRKVEKQG